MGYTYWNRKLVREQLDKKLVPLKDTLSNVSFPYGWIRMVRDALGMSAQELANRIGVDQSRITRIEAAERDGQVKLSTLRKVAQGLEMEFFYGFVPKGTLEEMVREQAKKIALERLQRLNHTMRLEMQELSDEEKNNALKDMIDKILIDEPKDLWKK
jgi:predicted DNA-binding mobile mystery protein A